MLFNSNSAIFQLYHGKNKLIFNEMMMRFGPLCTRPTRLVGLFYSASSLKQQSADRHVAPIGHIILMPNQPVFALSPQCCVLSEEATNSNFIVFGFTCSGFEPTIYRTRGEHANHIDYKTRYVLPVCSLKMDQTQVNQTNEVFSKLQFVTLKKYIKGMHYYI